MDLWLCSRSMSGQSTRCLSCAGWKSLSIDPKTSSSEAHHSWHNCHKTGNRCHQVPFHKACVCMNPAACGSQGFWGMLYSDDRPEEDKLAKLKPSGPAGRVDGRICEGTARMTALYEFESGWAIAALLFLAIKAQQQLSSRVPQRWTSNGALPSWYPFQGWCQTDTGAPVTSRRRTRCFWAPKSAGVIAPQCTRHGMGHTPWLSRWSTIKLMSAPSSGF